MAEKKKVEPVNNPVEDRKMTFQRYVERYGKIFNKYKIASASTRYRGMIKEKREWDKVLASFMQSK